jgi:hypothetical protein
MRSQGGLRARLLKTSVCPIADALRKTKMAARRSKEHRGGLIAPANAAAGDRVRSDLDRA